MTTAQAHLIRSERQAGYTFIEMMITMLVIGLLAAVVIPSVLGQREKAEGATAASLLRTGSSAVEAASVDGDGYATLTTAQLAAEEPNLAWLPAPGARAPRNEVSVSGLGPQGYTLTTTTGSGQVYVFTKNLTGTPAVTRTCGAGCTW